MFKKLAMTLAGLAVAATALLVTGAIASAEEPVAPPASEHFVCPGVPGDHGPYDHPWLRRSIIESAAEVLNVPNYVVVDGLRHGLSLNQIAHLNGVGTERLKAGILRDEAGDLHRRAHQGFITHAEARLIWNWLQNHIDEVVHRHFDCIVTAADEPAA